MDKRFLRGAARKEAMGWPIVVHRSAADGDYFLAYCAKKPTLRANAETKVEAWSATLGPIIALRAEGWWWLFKRL